MLQQLLTRKLGLNVAIRQYSFGRARATGYRCHDSASTYGLFGSISRRIEEVV